jgi:hypothetical protein
MWMYEDRCVFGKGAAGSNERSLFRRDMEIFPVKSNSYDQDYSEPYFSILLHESRGVIVVRDP